MNDFICTTTFKPEWKMLKRERERKMAKRMGRSEEATGSVHTNTYSHSENIVYVQLASVGLVRADSSIEMTIIAHKS